MRLYLPERVPIQKVFLFATVLMLVQLYQHTNFGFSLLFFGFTIASAYAFNIAGGFSRVIGSYIFSFAMLVPYIGVFWKSVLGEPAESNLKSPLLDITAYTASMVMLAIVSIITAKFDFRTVGFSAKAPKLDYRLAALGCLVFWVFFYQFAIMFLYTVPGVLSFLRQVDLFRQLAIILGTIYVIQQSGGRRSMSLIVFIPMIWLMWDGMLAASKQGMMTPFVCWLVAATYMRLKLNLIRSACILFVAILSFTLFTQMSQARNRLENATYSQRIAIVADEIINYREMVAANNAALPENPGSEAHHYYDSNQNGLLGRLSMMSPDDSFFNYASTVPPIGLDSILTDFQGLIPNILLSKKKVGFGAGNHYAHEIGGYLAPNDDLTGISFSPVPEAYHLARWLGIFLVLPGIWVLLFLSIDFVCGDVKKAPWALLVMVFLGHAAPESLISGLIYYIGYGNFGMFVAIMFCTRLAPILGSFMAGSSLSNTPAAAIRPRPRTHGQPALP